MPECALNLSQAAVYLALAPKSNASCDGDRAGARRRAASTAPIRLHPPPGLPLPRGRKLGRGVGYEYPHELPEGVSDQPLMPEGLEDRRYYEPTERGFEKTLRERLERIRKLRAKSK